MQSPQIGPLNFPRLARGVGGLLVVLGAILFLSYFAKLVTGGGPFDGFPIETNDFTYYLGATAGSAMLVWGVILFRSANQPSTQPLIARGSAIGFAMLSGMRLFALTSEEMREVGGGALIVESIVFGAIAVALLVLCPRPDSSAAG